MKKRNKKRLKRIFIWLLVLLVVASNFATVFQTGIF